MEYNATSLKIIITLAWDNTRSCQIDHSNHNEPDTLMISLAVAGSLRYPEAQLAFFNQDTDVLVLAVAD